MTNKFRVLALIFNYLEPIFVCVELGITRFPYSVRFLSVLLESPVEERGE